MSGETAIIDYGMGNLRSVANAVAHLGGRPVVVDDPGRLSGAASIILPGVGAFGDGMASLREKGWDEAVREQVLDGGKPFLGICLGMQLMASRGTEFGDHQGLDLIPGVVDRLDVGATGLRLPHIGWNDTAVVPGGRLFRGLENENPTFYFVHSFVFNPADEACVAATCDYGRPFAAALESDNVFATQFHPEKSQKAGLAVLKNFLEAGPC